MTQSIVTVTAPTSGDAELTLSGTVDVAVAEQLHQAAMQLSERGTDVSVNCEKADYFDPSALQLIWGLKQSLAQKKKQLKLTGVSNGLADWFRLAGLETAMQ